MAFASAYLGHVAFARGQHSRAREYYRQSLAIFETTEEWRWAVGRLHNHLGDVAIALGEYGEAAEHHRLALAYYQELDIYWDAVDPAFGRAWGIPVSLHDLGAISLVTGDLQEARQYYQQGLEIAIDKPFAQLKVYVVLGPSRWLARNGEVERATELATLALHHPDSIEEVQDKAQRILSELEGQLSPDPFAAAQERGWARDLRASLAELLERLDEETTAKGEVG